MTPEPPLILLFYVDLTSPLHKQFFFLIKRYTHVSVYYTGVVGKEDDLPC